MEKQSLEKEKMDAVICKGPGDYQLQQRDIPRPDKGEVLVEIEAVGICASDIKCYSGAPLFWGDEDREGYCQPPITPGHEFVGRVVELGQGADDNLEVGDRVISEQIIPCGECYFCVRGYYWMCERNLIYGFRQGAEGAMAEYMIFPADARNYHVPESLTLQEAVYIEPLACAIHAVQRGEIGMDDVVVIAGCGSLGLGMVAAARQKNPRQIVAVDLMDYRLQKAKKCGADVCLNAAEVDVVEEIKALTDGYGCDVYIEASGHPAGVAQGLHSIRKLGTFVEFSLFKEPPTVDWTIIGDSKELDIHGSHLGPFCYPIAINMLKKGQVPAEEIVTHTLSLSEFEKGLAMVEKPEESKSVKVALIP